MLDWFCRFAGVAVVIGAAVSPLAAQDTSGTVTSDANSTEAQAIAAAQAAVARESLGDLLAKVPVPKGPEADAPYATVPPELDLAVRLISMDNFTSAVAELQPIYQKAQAEKRAEAAMWLGIAHGLHAISYPNPGWDHGTSSSTYLKEAMQLDPKVIQAPDACRVMAEMVAHGWGNEDPGTALKRAEEKAEETRRPLDFYFAGVISRRLAARAWGYSDTTEEDKKTLSLFAKAVAVDPNRYESWSAYLPALMPVGMHDLATTEAKKMYEHFKGLRTPVMVDQGPAILKINTSSYRTMKEDADQLEAISKQWPDSPVPPFETAMRAIESTPPLAMELFPKMIADFESGKIKPTPREAGYYISSIYKYAFLLQAQNMPDESIAMYKKARELSPGYAEVNMNIGILLAQKSDKESTGTKKLELMEESLTYVQEQEKWDYRGKAALKANEMRQRLRSVIYRTKLAMKDEQTSK